MRSRRGRCSTAGPALEQPGGVGHAGEQLEGVRGELVGGDLGDDLGVPAGVFQCLLGPQEVRVGRPALDDGLLRDDVEHVGGSAGDVEETYAADAGA